MNVKRLFFIFIFLPSLESHFTNFFVTSKKFRIYFICHDYLLPIFKENVSLNIQFDYITFYSI